MKLIAGVLVLGVLGLLSCDLPTPGPIPTPTPMPQPSATPSPSANPSPSATPKPTPTPVSTPSPTPPPPPPTPTPTPQQAKAQAPFLAVWNLVRPNGSTKPAKQVCRSYKEHADGTIDCNKDSTCLYASNDPLNRWEACNTVGAPSCDADHWSSDACTLTMCTGGVVGAEPRTWCEEASPNGPVYSVTGGSCLVGWEHEPGHWDVGITARSGCLVHVKACPPKDFKTPDGIVVPVVGNGCGEMDMQF